MHTAEYHGFAGRFHARWRYLAATWSWPVLISLFLHWVLLWPSHLAVTAAAPSAAPLKAHLRTLYPLPVSPLAMPVRVPSVPRFVPTPTAPSTVAATPATQASPTPVQPSIEIAGLDAGAVRIYRIALSRALAAGPLRSGLEAGIRGTLEVGVLLGSFAPEVRVLRSSGNAALDAHVLACVRAAVSVAALPSPLQGRVATLSLPIEIGEAPVVAGVTAAVAGR